MRLFDLLATALACSSVASAASGLDTSPAVPAIAEGYLFSRQDNNNNNNSGGGGNNDNSNAGSGDNSNNNNTPSSSDSSNSQTTPAPTSSSDSNSDSNSSSEASQSGDNQKTSGQSTATKGGSTKTSLLPIDPQDPVGGLAMVTPAPTAASQYYKVGQTITWVWNYTSLLRPPQHIDILASFGAAGNVAPSPFTLAVNQSFEATQTFKWDTGKYTDETSPLPMGTYTLVVYDADAAGGVSHTPSPGYLGVWQQFRFGMYTPQQRTDLADPYICTTCNSAASLERLTVSALVVTTAMTVTSFMWFTGAWRIN